MPLSDSDGMGRPKGPDHPGYMALPPSDRIAIARYYDDKFRYKIAGAPDLMSWLGQHEQNFSALMNRYVRRGEEGLGKNEDGQPVYVPERQAKFDGVSEAWRLTERVYAFRPPNWQPGDGI